MPTESFTYPLAVVQMQMAIYRLFGECRFGFQESLRAAPDNLTAREELERCVCRLAEHEVSRRNPDAAAAAISVSTGRYAF